MADDNRNFPETDIPKVYNPKEAEKRWYPYWQENGYFYSEVDKSKTPYTILIPPPNVTGSLTIGHVLNTTIQDILIRRARMLGKAACWIPGTDHASIATETKVVNMLREKGVKKSDIPREEFLKYAWEWKKKYGSLIIEQLKKLGCSCDWKRERFTMDDGYYKAVISAFVTLYKKGLIYRGKRLVNWDPKTKSAISDEEVIYKEVNGHLWYFRYPLKDSDEFLTVATTRPETMLGDTAVAVNPDDKRFKHFIGKTVCLPLVGRDMPVIADKFVDPEFGTGCVKVTPAHDPNDFKMGKKHDLEMVNIFNDDATLNNNVPEEFQGLDRFDARKRVIEQLEKEGYLVKTEDYTTNIGYSERGNVPIEPYLSEQWFMKMEDLAKPALKVVKEGKIKFYPEHWNKTYYHWMENIQDWCISRQLWWGHRIPVWYCRGNDMDECTLECREPIVSETVPESCLACGSKDLVQDPDVLDTWASSWIWPMGVHSWPEESEDLSYFHPTDDLVTGPDIIFFWVARMIMSSIEFRGEIPFRNVYFTGMVRDLQGRKMSKSLGNSPDPLELIEKYGADALRFGIMLIAPQGQDILFFEDRIEVGRNFMNKLWNASRFILMNSEGVDILPINEIDSGHLEISDKWILSSLNRTINNVERRFDSYKFNDVAKEIYDFLWADFCDWYVEIIKFRLYGDDPTQKQIVLSIAIHCLKLVLKLLHPFAPFITEEIWSRLGTVSESDENYLSLIVSEYPESESNWIDEKCEEEFNYLKNIISNIRAVRSEMNVPPGKKSDLLITGQNGKLDFIKNHENIIKDLGKVGELETGNNLAKPSHSATIVLSDLEMFIPLEGLINVEKEKNRLKNEIERITERCRQIKGKLGNSDFVNKAPEEVVKREEKKLTDMTISLSKLEQNYEMIQ